MSITTNPQDPALREIEQSGMQKSYLVLSDEERAKGFVRPLRTSYRHVGIRPKYLLRDLTPEEHKQSDQYGYVKYEEYPESESPVTGRYWTRAQLNSGCGSVTTMGLAIAETYARDPKFYGGTFCCHCGKHLRVGEGGEFVWIEADGSDGPKVGT
jgi:hypothetical protein